MAAERIGLTDRRMACAGHDPASGQLETVQVSPCPPILQHPDERRRAGSVEAVPDASRGRATLVVVVARGAALEELLREGSPLDGLAVRVIEIARERVGHLDVLIVPVGAEAFVTLGTVLLAEGLGVEGRHVDRRILRCNRRPSRPREPSLYPDASTLLVPRLTARM